MRWPARALTGIAAVVLLGAALLAGYGHRALPRVDGSVRLAGAQQEIRIERDEHGIATVHAASLQDAAFALGVLHAQDRLWQLETHRRIAAGRLSEAFGPGALESDKFLRVLGVRRAAQAQWQRMAPEARTVVTAYAQGINQALEKLDQALPPEFLLLGVRPEPWQPEDSLGWATMMAWDLGGNWNTELLRLRLAMQLPKSRIDELLPPYPGDAPQPATDYPAVYRAMGLTSRVVHAWSRVQETAPESGVEGVGSNNWVLAGQRSATGSPLLANDPHLKLSAPSLWYLVRIQLPGMRIAGASMPGLPAIILGQNDHLAWGATNTGPDVQDLYIEEVGQGTPSRYRTPGGWADFDRTREVIRVKGAADVPLTVRRSRHGPVISDAGTAEDLLGPADGARFVLAMQWTALAEDIDSVTPMVAMMTATSVDDFVAASRGWLSPMQNFVVADRQGRIGHVSPGRVPLRRQDNDLAGLAPAPGWDARYDWIGEVPLEQTPREFDPARGWIATANQRIHDAGYPHYLGREWALPFRQARIEQMLDGRERHSLDDLAAMQADVQSLAAARLLPWLKRASSMHPLAAQAAPLIAAFDGRMDGGQAAPLIYWAWLRQLGIAVLADDLGDALWSRTLGRNWFDALEGVLQRDDGHWCDDRKTTETRETCAQRNDLALTRALEELEARFGRDVGSWRWSQAHVARSEHRPFSNVGLLAPWFELRVGKSGDTYSVNASRVAFKPLARTGELYLNEHGPSLRALYDVAQPANSRVMHSSGQSGLVFSRQYRNFVEDWVKVRYVPLWSAPARHTLTLQPAQAPS